MEWKGEESLILALIAIIFISVFVVFLVILFVKRKNKMLTIQEETKKQFKHEIVTTQVEIREQTLRDISWELHDNVGQLLTLAKIQLQKFPSEETTEINKTISRSLQEIRSLSKSINPDVIKNIELHEAIQLEIDRFNRLNFIDSSLIVKGKIQKMKGQSNIIIFRILQEFFTNTIKHAQATKLEVALDYQEKQLKITAKDNGKGFHLNKVTNGIGLQNIASRIKLIGAEVNLTSKINKGTELTINYFYKT